MKEDPDVKFARECVTETLHGPLPIKSSMRLAEAVLRLSGELAQATAGSADRIILNPDYSERADEMGLEHLVTLTAWRPPHVGRGAGAGGRTLLEATERALTRLTGMVAP